MVFGVVEVMLLVILKHSALQWLAGQVRLEHSQVEAHYSVPPQSAFAYSAHLVTRWAHLPRWM
jgi:hypothetical protein